MYILMLCAFKIWMMSATYLDACYISGRWRLHIWAGVTYLDDGGYISGRVLHIWTMEVTYLDGCYISGRWRLHIWKGVTYLDDGGYISGRVLHIWPMEVTYLDECYISGRWRLHIWKGVTYLNGYIYARHTCVPVYAHGTHEVKLFVEILTTSKVLKYGHCEHRYINVEIFSCVSI